jgi:hypothetical protein
LITLILFAPGSQSSTSKFREIASSQRSSIDGASSPSRFGSL